MVASFGEKFDSHTIHALSGSYNNSLELRDIYYAKYYGGVRSDPHSFGSVDPDLDPGVYN